MNGIQLSSFSYSFSLLFWSHFRRPTRAWFGPTNSLASTDWFVCMWHRRREKERLNDRKIERKTNRQREREGGADSNNANNSSSSHNSREICEKLTSSGLTSFFFPLFRLFTWRSKTSLSADSTVYQSRSSSSQSSSFILRRIRRIDCLLLHSVIGASSPPLSPP